MAVELGFVRAVSAAEPRDELIGGRTVHTSIVRDPAQGPLHFGPSGPVGNRTAVHIEHALAFSSANYDHWARELGVPRGAWPWCFWGENLTLDGLDESRLCIGDIVRCGEAEFEVAGPRTPCFKLSWRLGQDTAFLRRLAASGRVGVYLRVRRPGLVAAGDRVTLAPAGKTAVTVADVARMIADLAPAQIGAARELLALPELAETSRIVLGFRLNFVEDVARVRKHRWQGWRPFRIAALQREGRDATSVVLVPDDGKPIAPCRAGQHVAVRLPTSPAQVRTWSLSQFDAEPTRYRITVKRQAGAGSRWINDLARVGDLVELRAPAGRFALDRSSFHRVVLVSAGVGLTPLLAMLRAHLLRGAEAPAVHWLHSATDSEALLHAGEVEQLLRVAKQATRQIHLTAPSRQCPRDTFDRVGRITPADLADIWNRTFLSADGKIVEPGEYSHFYVCGPDGFTTMVIDALRAIGVEDDQIFTETFAPARAARPNGSRRQRAVVQLARSGLSLEWDPADDLTLLELAEAAGVDAPFSCRAGTCGTCETGLRSGEVEHDPPPESPVGPGRCLLCCARPASETVTLDL